MGRGGYNGGSTIITTWGSGWSNDARTPVRNAKKGVVKSKPPTIGTMLKKYARTCGVWTSNNKPWQEAPKLVKDHFKDDLEEIKKAVLEHPNYQNGLDRKNNKNNAKRPQAGAKKKIKEQRQTKQLLFKYVKSCAKSDFKNIPRPAIPEFVTEKFSQEDIAGWLSKIHDTEPYRSELIRLKRGKGLYLKSKIRKRNSVTNG